MKLYIVYCHCLRCMELILSENVYDLYKMYHMMLKMCEIICLSVQTISINCM